MADTGCLYYKRVLIPLPNQGSKSSLFCASANRLYSETMRYYQLKKPLVPKSLNGFNKREKSQKAKQKKEQQQANGVGETTLSCSKLKRECARWLFI
jgi:hypothetical protein